MAEQPAPSDGAPASPPEQQVQIELGPHDIYPEPTEPVVEPESEDDDAPEPDDAAPTPPARPDAGIPTEEPQPGQPQPSRRSRRQAGEEAYQRGLSEGRTQREREWQEQQHARLVEQTQREANDRIQNLFNQLTAPTFQQREEAGKALATMYQSTQQGNQALELARQQVHQQMAADFASVKDLDGATDADMQGLLQASSMSDFAKRVHGIGQRALQDRITKLEAELQAARAHAVGARATPEAQNGSGRIGQVAMHDLQSMSLKDIRRLEGTPEYDRMVQQHLADLAAGRI
jgi:hypothetical protein